MIISGDVRELDRLLRLQFPTAAIKLYPTAASTLIMSGYIDRPDYVNRIVRIAEDYFPKVINNMVVGGSQQVLLYVQVMQVSRTKLRNLGVDMMGFSGANYGGTTVAGLITKAAAVVPLARTTSSFTTNGLENMQFGLLSGANGVVGMIEALKQDDILKVLAEPLLTTISGRPASCNVGGEVAYPQPTGFGNISVAFRPFGTQVDFVPIVLGNGGCRLEVRPRVSEVDYTLGTTINGTVGARLPRALGRRRRRVEVRPDAGHRRLAVAGYRSASQGHPVLDGRSVYGHALPPDAQQGQRDRIVDHGASRTRRRARSRSADACRPGATSLSPDDCGQYFKGYREVPIPASMVPPMMGPGPVGPMPVAPETIITPPQPGGPLGPAPPEIKSGRVTTPGAGSPQAASAGPSSRRSAGSAVIAARPDSYNRTDRQMPKAPSASSSNSPPGSSDPRVMT